MPETRSEVKPRETDGVLSPYSHESFAKSLFRATPSIVIEPMIPSETRLEYILDANCSTSTSVSIDFNWSGRAEINVPTIRLSKSGDTEEEEEGSTLC